MTGKIQKQKNDVAAFKAAVQLSEEDKQSMINEAIAEIYAANSGMMDTLKISYPTFRGGFLLHTLFGQIQATVEKKCEATLAKKVEEYMTAKNLERRK